MRTLTENELVKLSAAAKLFERNESEDFLRTAVLGGAISYMLFGADFYPVLLGTLLGGLTSLFMPKEVGI